MTGEMEIKAEREAEVFVGSVRMVIELQHCQRSARLDRRILEQSENGGVSARESPTSGETATGGGGL